MRDWKSTAAGVLSFIVTTLLIITGWLGTYMLTAPASTAASLTKYSAFLTLATALARAWIGWLTNNADATATANAINSVSPVATPAVTADKLAQTPSKLAGMVLVALFAGTLLSGCSNFERDTFNTLATSKSVIDTAQDAYVAKTIPQNACTFAVINDAKAAQTVAVNSMLVYETEKAAGKDLSAQTSAITEDLAQILPLVAQIKTLYTNPSACVAPKTGATS